MIENNEMINCDECTLDIECDFCEHPCYIIEEETVECRETFSQNDYGKEKIKQQFNDYIDSLPDSKYLIRTSIDIKYWRVVSRIKVNRVGFEEVSRVKLI